MRRRVLLQMYLQLVDVAPEKQRLRWRHWTECPLDRTMVNTLMRWWVPAQVPTVQIHTLYHCWYCGVRPDPWQPRLLYDHIFPQCYNTTPLVLACLYCNSSKRDKTPAEWRGNASLFWFDHVGLGPSPLGYAIREDRVSFQRLFTRYLNGCSPPLVLLRRGV
jgi:hypothetical protein